MDTSIDIMVALVVAVTIVVVETITVMGAIDMTSIMAITLS
jgi:hypothetical protein